MSSQKSVQQKRRFLRWFLKSQDLKEPKAAKIIELFLKRQSLLERVKLVDKLGGLSNCILISSKGTTASPVLFRLGGNSFNHVEEGLLHLMVNPPREVYLCLVFRGYSHYLDWKDLLANQGRQVKRVKVVRAAKVHSIRKDWILKQIDAALDKRDRKAFMRLTKQLKELA